MADIPKVPVGAASSSGFEPREFRPFAKRVFDVVASLCLIVFFAPLMLIVAAIVFTQVGPRVIFPHTREGKDGHKFQCLKFRTMYLDADKRLEAILRTDPVARAEWETSRKMENDARILPFIGSFLRASCLDELPQLFNVFLGDMSLVGPRPVVEEEIRDHYGDTAQLYYSVRPGMTGPWQVSNRTESDYETRVRQDADYVLNWSLWGDVVILVKTLLLITKVRSHGAR